MIFLLKTDSISEKECKELYSKISYRFCDEESRTLRKESICGRLLLHYVLRVHGLTDYKVLCPKNAKPYIEGRPLHFSISHSGDYLMLALGDREVGCDVELWGEYRQRIADRFFTGKEQKLLASAQDKTDLFFRLWVLKESILKLKGEGIGGGLDTFDFAGYVREDSFFAYGCNFRIFGLPDAFACVCGEEISESLEIISHTKITELFI